jgi:hypothetical protein
MSEWRIHRREPGCASCARAFEEGEWVYSHLRLDAERLQRADHCQACFENAKLPEGPFWRSRHRDRRGSLAVDYEALEELFLALEGRAEARLEELRYLLALLLLRKKRLKLVGVRRHATGESLCLRRPRRSEEFDVRVFELDPARAQTLKAELARVFEGAGVESLLVPGKPSPLAS